MKKKLLFTNQVVAPHIKRWVEDYARHHGTIEVWTGNSTAFDVPLDKLQVIQFPDYSRASIKSRLRTWLHYSFSMFFRLWRTPRQTPVLVTTNPPTAPLVMWLVSKMRRQPYVLYEFDIYPHIGITMSVFSEKNLIYRLWHKLHQLALKDAKAVITLGNNMSNILCDMIVDRKLNAHVIPNWVDTDWVKRVPREVNPFAHEHSIDKQLVVGYAGNLGATHSVEHILSLAKTLKHREDILFFIIGAGAKLHLVEDAIKSGEYPNLRLLPWIPYENLPSALSAIDVSIVTLSEGYEMYSIPSKTMNSLSAGCAILGMSREPNDLAQLIQTNNCGQNFHPSDVLRIAEWVECLADNRMHLAEYQGCARATAEKWFDEKICISRLNEVLEDHLLLSVD